MAEKAECVELGETSSVSWIKAGEVYESILGVYTKVNLCSFEKRGEVVARKTRRP